MDRGNIRYYRNKQSKQIFVSTDGGVTLINTFGKLFRNSTSFFEKTFPAPLTIAQKVAVEEVSRIWQMKMSQRGVIKHIERRAVLTIFRGCHMTIGQKEDIEAGKQLLVVSSDGKKYQLIDIQGLTPHSVFNTKRRAVQELNEHCSKSLNT